MPRQWLRRMKTDPFRYFEMRSVWNLLPKFGIDLSHRTVRVL